MRSPEAGLRLDTRPLLTPDRLPSSPEVQRALLTLVMPPTTSPTSPASGGRSTRSPGPADGLRPAVLYLEARLVRQCWMVGLPGAVSDGRAQPAHL
jgi:hypothetical protein